MLSMFSFSGRAGRLQYWMVQLVLGIVLVVLLMVGSKTMPLTAANAPHVVIQGFMKANIALQFAVLAMLVLNICTLVRRYHDLGKSGWWYFICFVPVIGAIWQFVECGFVVGEDSRNQYDTSDDDVVIAVDSKREEAKATLRAMQTAASTPSKISVPSGPVKPAPRPVGFGTRGGPSRSFGGAK